MEVSELRFNVNISRKEIMEKLGFDPNDYDDKFHRLAKEHGDALVEMARDYIVEAYKPTVRALRLSFNECDNMLNNYDAGVFLGLYYYVGV